MNLFSNIKKLGPEAMFLIISKGIWNGTAGFTVPLEKVCKELMTPAQVYYMPFISKISVIVLAILWEKFEPKLLRWTVPRCIFTMVLYTALIVINLFTQNILLWYFINYTAQITLFASISSGISTLRAWNYQNSERTTYDRTEKVVMNGMALIGIILGLIFHEFVVTHIMFSANLYCVVSILSCISRIVFYENKKWKYTRE